MAACGIAEHHEARRRQSQAERKSYKTKILIDTLQQKIGESPPSSYDQEVEYIRKVGSPPGASMSHPSFVDRKRREQLRQQQLVEYTAKLPNRFSSQDYISQW
ncbi:hypothetical protein ScPMuIL_017027 [Solemya velum]